MFTGKHIQKARRRLGMTQEQLAEAIDVSPPYVSLLESGKRHPSAKVQRDLLRVLRLDELGARALLRDVKLSDLPPASSRAMMATYAATSALTGSPSGTGFASRLEQLITAFARLPTKDQDTVLALAGHLESRAPEAQDDWTVFWRGQLDQPSEEENE